jgi:hypothetical protein
MQQAVPVFRIVSFIFTKKLKANVAVLQKKTKKHEFPF